MDFNHLENKDVLQAMRIFLGDDHVSSCVYQATVIPLTY